MARNERGQHCRTLNLQSSSRIIKTYHSIKNWGYEPHIETETAPNACLLDKGGNQVRDLKIVPLYQVQTNPGPWTASSRSWDWFKTGGHVFCYYWWFWVSAIQLFLVRHGNNIGRETGRGTGNSWRRIEKVIRSDSFWVWRCDSRCTNCIELLVLMICSFCHPFPQIFNDRMPRNQADIGTLLRVSTSVVVEKITLGLESISKLEFKLISAEYLVVSLLRR